MKPNEARTEWKERKEASGGLVERYKTEKAIITIHWPELDDEEQARRVEAIKEAAAELLIELYRVRALREREEE